jgi:hypothetical protein
MAITITTAMPTSFKVELLKGLHNFTAGSTRFKMALFTAIASGSGTYGAATTNYSDMGADELATATGYTRPGQLLTSVTPTADGTTAILDFTNETWTSSTFTTCGGLIYDTGDSDSACAVLSFGGDQSVSTGDFQIQFPAAASATAIIRIA